MINRSLLVVSLFVASSAFAHEHTSVIQASPSWDKLKTLTGKWTAEMEMNGKKTTSELELRLTGDNSALMHQMAAGTPHEMITMFAPDGTNILATHYCGGHNQPRLTLKPSKEPNQLVFDFKDATNLKKGDAYMKKLVVTFVDDTHHREDWTNSDGSKMTFEYTRAEPAAKAPTAPAAPAAPTASPMKH